MIRWIDKSFTLAIQARQLAEHGGIPGDLDEALLDSALARPQQLLVSSDPPPDLATLAASLAIGLARDHPFVDANKRTAHVCYRVFIAINGSDLGATEEEKYLAIVSLAVGSVTEAGFAEWLRKHIVSRPNRHERRAKRGR